MAGGFRREIPQGAVRAVIPCVVQRLSPMIREGHTLIECITVVLILSVLAFIAVPRLNLGTVWGGVDEYGRQSDGLCSGHERGQSLP